MKTDISGWSQVACDDLKKTGTSDEIFYYHRVLGEEKYAAHVFIAQYISPEQLKQNWERLNDNIALLYQSNVESLLERSNFYLCFFLPEPLVPLKKKRLKMMLTVQKNIFLLAKRSCLLKKSSGRSMRKFLN